MHVLTIHAKANKDFNALQSSSPELRIAPVDRFKIRHSYTC